MLWHIEKRLANNHRSTQLVLIWLTAYSFVWHYLLVYCLVFHSLFRIAANFFLSHCNKMLLVGSGIFSTHNVWCIVQFAFMDSVKATINFILIFVSKLLYWFAIFAWKTCHFLRLMFEFSLELSGIYCIFHFIFSMKFIESPQ